MEHHAISMYTVSCPLRVVYWNTYAVFIVYAPLPLEYHQTLVQLVLHLQFTT